MTIIFGLVCDKFMNSLGDLLYLFDNKRTVHLREVEKNFIYISSSLHLCGDTGLEVEKDKHYSNLYDYLTTNLLSCNFPDDL